MARNGIDPKIMKTPEWREAEKWYSQMHAAPVFSVFGGGLMPAPDDRDFDQEMERLLAFCPDFYPAWFHHGEYMLRQGRSKEGEKSMEKGFDSLVKVLADEDELMRVLSFRLDNLEKLLRCDVAVKLLEKAIRLFPEEATFYDELAYFILQLPEGDKSEALRFQQKALELAPDNDYFINNLGWIQLMMGSLKEAGENFQKALDYDVDNPAAIKNLDTVEYMQKHKLNYNEYLVRPADKEEIVMLLENVDFEGATGLCRDYNKDREEAFKIFCLQEKQLPPHEVLNILQPLQFFFKHLEGMASGELFLYENTDLLNNRLKSYLYQFILDIEFIEQPLLEAILLSVTLFYDFLKEKKVLPPDRHQQFMQNAATTIAAFAARIDDYNNTCHDVQLSEEERAQKIAEIFGMQYLDDAE